jgi:hypothetical protein
VRTAVGVAAEELGAALAAEDAPSMRAWAEEEVPVRRWQRVQWQ